jgi:GDP-fucose transporter C1
MAFYIWGNEPTVMGVLGIFTTLGGSLLYTFVKMGENASAAPAPVMQQQGEKEQEMSKV